MFEVICLVAALVRTRWATEIMVRLGAYSPSSVPWWSEDKPQGKPPSPPKYASTTSREIHTKMNGPHACHLTSRCESTGVLTYMAPSYFFQQEYTCHPAVVPKRPGIDWTGELPAHYEEAGLRGHEASCIVCAASFRLERPGWGYGSILDARFSTLAASASLLVERKEATGAHAHNCCHCPYLAGFPTNLLSNS